MSVPKRIGRGVSLCRHSANESEKISKGWMNILTSCNPIVQALCVKEIYLRLIRKLLFLPDVKRGQKFVFIAIH